jgi:hypothetical protein
MGIARLTVRKTGQHILPAQNRLHSVQLYNHSLIFTPQSSLITVRFHTTQQKITSVRNCTHHPPEIGFEIGHC